MICPEKEQFFADMAAQHVALTYDDVRMETVSGRDEPLPEIIDITSQFSRNVELKVPFVSAAMDTVTTGDMAISMAKLGGIGVVHAALPIDLQRKEVRRVKKEVNGLIENPRTVSQSMTLEQVLNWCQDYKFDFRTFPVTDSENKFVGMLSGDAFKYAEDLGELVSDTMKHAEYVISAPIDTTLDEAYSLMQKLKINTLPLLDEVGAVSGLYIYSDVRRIHHDLENYNVDDKGQLRVAAAVSTGADALERVSELSKYVDVVVLDTADGDSYYAFQTLERIKADFPNIDVVIGNISTGTSAIELAEAGADGIKVGQGPGSICTTRRETGIGKPQVTAVYETIKALGSKYADVPVVADGGIKEHGDIPIAFAAGAHSVMMGRMLAGTKEAPGEVISRPDGARVKIYRGMGSIDALQDNAASRERYGVGVNGPVLAEGVVSQVPYEGSVFEVLGLCISALRKGMRYVKAPDITTHREKTKLFRITNAGLRESHPHDITIIAT